MREATMVEEEEDPSSVSMYTVLMHSHFIVYNHSDSDFHKPGLQNSYIVNIPVSFEFESLVCLFHHFYFKVISVYLVMKFNGLCHLLTLKFICTNFPISSFCHNCIHFSLSHVAYLPNTLSSLISLARSSPCNWRKISAWICIR